MKRTFIALVIATIAAGSALAQSAKVAEEKIVARVNGDVITVAQLDYMWNTLPEEARTNYELSGGGKIGFLDNYIDRRLVVQQAMKERFDQRYDVQQEVARSKERVIMNMYVEQVVAAEVFSDADMRQYYQNNRREFSRPERYKARHIVVTPAPMPVYNSANDDAGTEEAALKKIEMIRSQLNDPKAQFADLAAKFSEDISAKSGGDLGWVSRGKLTMALDEALFKLEPGQVSGVLKTEFGYHIIRCDDREAAGFKSFEEAKSEIVEKMLKDRQTDVMAGASRLTQELRRASSITVYRENL